MWKHQADETIIDFYEQHRFLWDCRERDYFKRDLKDTHLAQLAQVLGPRYTVGSVKKRWKHLRDTYVRKHKVLQGMKRSGASSEDIQRFLSKWDNYERLMFICDPNAQRESISYMENSRNHHVLEDTSNTATDTVSSDTEQQVSIPNFSGSLSTDLECTPSILIMSAPATSSMSVPSASEMSASSTSAASASPSMSGTPSLNESECISMCARPRKRRNSAAEESSSEHLLLAAAKCLQENDDDIWISFGKYVGNCLRRMGPDDRKRVHRQISDLLIDVDFL